MREAGYFVKSIEMNPGAILEYILTSMRKMEKQYTNNKMALN